MDLRITKGLELISRLKGTLEDFAMREDQVVKEFRSRRYALAREHHETNARFDAATSARTAGAEAELKAEEERLGAILSGRRQRIEKAHASLMRNLPKRAQETKGQWLGKLQMKQRNADRARAASIEEANNEAAELARKLETRRTEFTSLANFACEVFSGYGSLVKLLARRQDAEPGTKEASGDFAESYGELKERIRIADEQLCLFKRFVLPRFFRLIPLAVLIPLIAAGAAVLAVKLGLNAFGIGIGAASGAGLILALAALYSAGKKAAGPTALTIAQALGEARRLHGSCTARSSAHHAAKLAEIEADYDETRRALSARWGLAETVESQFETAIREKLTNQFERVIAKNEALIRPKLDQVAAQRAERVGAFQAAAAIDGKKAGARQDAENAALAADEESAWQQLEKDWKTATGPLSADIAELNAAVAPHFPAWNECDADAWTPPAALLPFTRFGQLDIDFAQHADAVPKSPRLALDGGLRKALPLVLTYPDSGSLLFETADSADPAIVGTLNNVIFRLLHTSPPGKITFTIIDPVGLGQNFAGLMGLADYEEALINRRIWTQREHIDERLAELSEHIEKVIQMYLRNEFASIADYNAEAGSVAEKYHFLVVADFPSGFSEPGIKRLQSIAASGLRCGVFTLIHWDPRQPAPDELVPEELRKNAVCIRRHGTRLVLPTGMPAAGTTLTPDPPPDAGLALSLVHKIGKASVDSNRVEVPFTQVAPPPGERWTSDTTSELRVAIGRTGATKLQYLAIGKGTRQHALFAGKTGSGKSTLFHVIITNLALTCSPEQVEFYLIDFKKGVEFKCYAEKRLPHARVVAIESDREFGLSVLRRVDAELKHRGDMFRKIGAQDLAGYKRMGGTGAIPRTLLIIDEFQEFFVEDDEIAQQTSVLLDRIVRQGRAFGIHVLLGSQTLGGAYTLARATLGQMVIRVALQCNEADAYLIMDESNAAPRLLSRPGEGIYNDAAGAMEGNSPFQVVWLGDEERDRWLDQVQELAAQHGDRHPAPIVFEGNAPADVRGNERLAAALDTRPAAAPAAGHCWLGAPNSIKGPTEAVFRRQSGNHLLIVGQRDDAAQTMIAVSLVSLAAQFPVGTAKFILIDSAAPDSPDATLFNQATAAIPHGVTIVRSHDIPGAMNELAGVLAARGSAAPENAPPVFVFIHGLQKFKKLRAEDDFDFSAGSSDSGPNPAAQFRSLITEGSSHGIHIIATVDTCNNVNRFMNRKMLGEFELRIVFQMSANDSSSLIDSPKASALGLHRALLHNEQEGTQETFRPYASPDAEWFRAAGEKLAGT